MDMAKMCYFNEKIKYSQSTLLVHCKKIVHLKNVPEKDAFFLYIRQLTADIDM